MDLLYKNTISEELASQLSHMIPKMDSKDAFLFVDGSWNKNRRDVSGFGFIALIPTSKKEYTIYMCSGSTDDSFITSRFGNENFASMRNVFGEVSSTIYGVDTICNEWELNDDEWELNKLHKSYKTIKKISIFYDYEGIRKWVTKEWKSKNTLTKRYRKMLSELSYHVMFKFFKVDAHSGVIINDIADILAKDGIYRDITEILRRDVEISIDKSYGNYKESILEVISENIIDMAMDMDINFG